MSVRNSLSFLYNFSIYLISLQNKQLKSFQLELKIVCLGSSLIQVLNSTMMVVQLHDDFKLLIFKTFQNSSLDLFLETFKRNPTNKLIKICIVH